MLSRLIVDAFSPVGTLQASHIYLVLLTTSPEKARLSYPSDRECSSGLRVVLRSKEKLAYIVAIIACMNRKQRMNDQGLKPW